LLFPAEANFPANNGISDSIAFLTPFLDNHNVSAADLVQFAGAAGLTQCPGAPQLEFMAGRKDATQIPPDGLVPLPSDSVTSILNRFRDAGGFDANEVVALLASHTVARADHVDPNLAAVPFDSTPFTVSTSGSH
jgi:cytochrome c peroxidase